MSREEFARHSPDDIRIAPEALTRDVAALFRRLGCSDSGAHRVAKSLVASNLLGHDSHGVSLIGLYARMIREGKVDPRQEITIRSVAPGLLAVDAKRALGQIAAWKAMEAGIAEVRRHGLALIALRESHHVARIGEWAEQCADAGYASIHFVNVVGAAPVVAPFGGSEPRLNTNPICIGLPREGALPIVLDFATSRVAQGKMRVLRARGETAPIGHLIDPEGRPSRDPGIVYPAPGETGGALLPFGEHKGFGLGLLCDLLCGAAIGARSTNATTITDGVYVNNMVSLVFDMDRLSERSARTAEMEAAIGYVLACRPSDEGPARLPGDGGRAESERRRRDGIPIDRETWADLSRVFAEANLPLST